MCVYKLSGKNDDGREGRNHCYKVINSKIHLLNMKIVKILRKYLRKVYKVGDNSLYCDRGVQAEQENSLPSRKLSEHAKAYIRKKCGIDPKKFKLSADYNF